jgi:hypothetical protein
VGTGKSFIYENISPHIRLVSGGNISPAVLFVNSANGLPGILARYSTVVLDEVQTLKFERPEEIVGGLKGYLANGQLTRGSLHQIARDFRPAPWSSALTRASYPALLQAEDPRAAPRRATRLARMAFMTSFYSRKKLFH